MDSLKARIDHQTLPAPPVQEDFQEAEWQGQEDFSAGRPIVHVETPSSAPEAHTLSVRKTEEELIRQALDKYHGNRKKAAEELGMSERSLYRKLPEEYRKK